MLAHETNEILYTSFLPWFKLGFDCLWTSFCVVACVVDDKVRGGHISFSYFLSSDGFLFFDN